MERHITRRRRLFVLLAGLFGFLASTAVSAVPGAAVSDALSTGTAAASESVTLRSPSTERRSPSPSSPSPSDLGVLARLVAAAHAWAEPASQQTRTGQASSARLSMHVAWAGVPGHSDIPGHSGVPGHSGEGHFRSLVQHGQYVPSLRAAEPTLGLPTLGLPTLGLPTLGLPTLAHQADPAHPARTILAASIQRRGPPSSTGHPTPSR